ncbi:MAG TPA: CoA transferase [Baekduia sp.]
MLPTGVPELGRRFARAGAALLAERGGCDLDVSPAAVWARLDPGAPRSSAPVPAGDGALAADLGVEENARAFATLCSVADPDVLADPEALAAEAQCWRLPVVPYRAPERGARGRVRVVRRRADGPPPPSGAPLVLDLTAMWAGPLATSLLASTGAHVVKVEPDVRRDGLRGTPGLFATLNAGKSVQRLDLREPAHRGRFFALAASATLVVESFSPRVLGNLDIAWEALDAVAPGITVLSMPAFDPTAPERDWVAYGTGVHAACGLGAPSPGRWLAPPFPYPDPLAGLLAFAVAQALLLGRERGTWHGGHVVAPLAAAASPLVAGAAELVSGFGALPGVPDRVLDLLAGAA